MSTRNLSALFPLDHLTITADEAILCVRGMVSTMWCMSTTLRSLTVSVLPCLGRKLSEHGGLPESLAKGMGKAKGQ